ncbi:MAG: Gfo/Idh/MocA family oxidoreductase [Acidobacteria bacterium]|nr:Gfo/Idh/MocA family oxidoreductase [Acidobacteriota bacterium]
MSKVHNVCIVGAGYISLFHIEALKLLPNINIAAVCDSNAQRATALAKKWGIPQVFSTIDDLIASQSCDVAHVLVPPDLHRKVAEPLLRAGLHVMVEKPLAVSAADCEALLQAAQEKNVKLGINHNSTFRPSFTQLKEIIRSNQVGHLHHVICHLNVPLRQLGAKQFSHWMFQLPQNLFLEQGVHPLSQIYDLIGNASQVTTLTSGHQQLAPGVEIYDTWQVSLVGERATAQLFLSVGQDFPSWQITAICEDGTIHADFLHERCLVQTRTKEMDFYNSLRTGARMTGQLAKQSLRGAAGYVLSQLKLVPKTDPFIVSINEAVAAFYDGIDNNGQFVDGKAGADVIKMCEQVTAKVATPTAISPAIVANGQPASPEKFDVVVIGGTGFIGSHLIRQLMTTNQRVKVIARNTRTLPEIFHHPNIKVVAGDISNEKVIDAAVADVPVVIHLAHGGGGETWEEIKRSMVDGTRVIAEACLRHKTKRLIYIGTIASLYLGDASECITGNTPNDPSAETRALYSRGKAACEDILNKLHKEQNLPVVILRPGVVIGEGGMPFHSGIGFANQEGHMIGWNDGSNPLPFILVEDCASAIACAMKAPGIEGKSYNLVGDQRPSARQYMKALSTALGRPVRFYPQSVLKLQLIEIGKWIIKRATGRRDAPFPSYRDLKSRGLVAPFDTTDVKRDLGWMPIQDEQAFIQRGIAIHQKRQHD